MSQVALFVLARATETTGEYLSGHSIVVSDTSGEEHHLSLHAARVWPRSLMASLEPIGGDSLMLFGDTALALDSCRLGFGRVADSGSEQRRKKLEAIS